MLWHHLLAGRYFTILFLSCNEAIHFLQSFWCQEVMVIFVANRMKNLFYVCLHFRNAIIPSLQGISFIAPWTSAPRLPQTEQIHISSSHSKLRNAPNVDMFQIKFSSFETPLVCNDLTRW